MAKDTVAYHAVSIRLACMTFNISDKCYRYQSILKDDNAVIAA